MKFSGGICLVLGALTASVGWTACGGRTIATMAVARQDIEPTPALVTRGGGSDDGYCRPAESQAPGPLVPIVAGERLARFYAALQALDRGERNEPVRIAAFGDSNLTMDLTTGFIRRHLQNRFGDGGHGFVAAARPWSHYQHQDVRHGVISGFRAFAITTNPTGDGMYGLGGIVAENRWQGARTFFETANEFAPTGRMVAQFDIFFLRRRWGGSFDLVVDGAPLMSVSTRGERGLGHERLEVPLGPHRLEVVAASGDAIRILGAALETRNPGVVIDSFGVGALNTTTLLHLEKSHAQQMLRARNYDLVMFMTGANDLFVLEQVPSAMRELAARIREALPHASLLVLTPADRGRFRSLPLTLRVVEQRRAIAEDIEASFWDFWQAMGGRDAMSRYVREGWAEPDAVHLNGQGAERVAKEFLQAFEHDYALYIQQQTERDCRKNSIP